MPSSCRALTSDNAVLFFGLGPADSKWRVQDFSEAQLANRSRCWEKKEQYNTSVHTEVNISNSRFNISTLHILFLLLLQWPTPQPSPHTRKPVVSHFIHSSLTSLPAERLSYSSETFNNTHTQSQPCNTPSNQSIPVHCCGYVNVYAWLLISLSHSIIAGC